MSSKPQNLIILDYDGTLADTFDLNLKLIQSFAPQIGLKKFNKKIFVDINSHNPFVSFEKRGLTPADIKLFLKLLQRESLKPENLPQIFPGWKSVIKKLASDNILTVVTSNLTRVAHNFLKNYDLEQCFSNILGSDKDKSKINKINFLIKKYSVKPPHIFYIGDTVGDIIEMRKTPCQIISVSWGYFSARKLKLVRPDFLIKKPQELVKIINQKIDN